MWVGYVNPESSLAVMSIMLNVLLMVIIGGMGTLYGGIAGAPFLQVLSKGNGIMRMSIITRRS